MSYAIVDNYSTGSYSVCTEGSSVKGSQSLQYGAVFTEHEHTSISVGGCWWYWAVLHVFGFFMLIVPSGNKYS